MTSRPLTTSLLCFLLKCTVSQLAWGRGKRSTSITGLVNALGSDLWSFFFSEIMGISESSGRRLEILSTVLENRHCVCVCVCVCVKATLVFKRMWEIKESEEWGQLEKPDPHWPWIVNLLKVKGTTLELWEGLDFYFEFSMYFSTLEANNFEKKILLF